MYEWRSEKFYYLSSEWAMKSQVLHTVWCNISGEAAGEIWTWSLLGVKGLAGYFRTTTSQARESWFVFNIILLLKSRSNERNMLHATSSNIVACNMLHRLNTLLHDVAWSLNQIKIPATCWTMLHATCCVRLNGTLRVHGQMPARACDVILLFCGILLEFVRPSCKTIYRVYITKQANN